MQDTKFEKKRHNTAETSVQSFLDFNRKKLRSRQWIKTYKAIQEHQPVTSRSLVRLTGLERSALTRVLFDGVNTADPLIKIAFSGPCMTTGKSVSHYTLIDWEAEPKKLFE